MKLPFDWTPLRDVPAVKRKILSSVPTTLTQAEPGTIGVYYDTRTVYICESAANGYYTWKQLGAGGLSWQAAVISKVVAQAGATATEGYRYISPAAGATWLENYIYEWKNGAWEQTTPVEGMACYITDVDEVDVYDGAAWDNLVSPATTLAGLTDTTIAGLADNDGFVYDSGTSKWLNQKITTASISATAAIEFTKLEALTEGNVLIGDASNDPVALDASGDAKILIGNATTIASFALTGDVAMTNGGLTTVTDLTMAAEAQGDVLYFDGTNWVVLAPVNDRFLRSNGAAANPSWETPTAAIASSLANGCTLNDAGALDAILAFTTQTIGAPTLTVPDFASVSDTFAFVTLAQTLLNKTLTAPTINGGQANSLTALSIRSSGAAFDLTHATAEVLTAGKTISWNVGDTARSITLGGNIALGGGLTTLGAWSQVGAFTLELTTTAATAVTLPTTGTLSTLSGVEELTNKTLTSPVIGTSIVLDQATADYTIVFSDPAAARQLTIGDPLGNDDFVFEDMAQTLTTKTISAASNTISGINGAELEDAAATTALGMAIPFVIKKDISNALTTALYAADFPQKARLIKAWVIESAGGNSGDVVIDDGTDTICPAVSYIGADTSVVDFDNIDDAYSTLAAGASLRAVNTVNTDDAMLYTMWIPIA